MPKRSTRSKAAKNPHVIARTLVGILLIALFIYTAWWFLGPGSDLRTSTLNLSFNRLSSTAVNVTIPEPGKLSISAGPSGFLDEARVLSLVVRSNEATPADPAAPFVISSDYQAIFNAPNPDKADEYVLAALFPKGHFEDDEQSIAELPFSTTKEGEFRVKHIFFGSLDQAEFDFPPSQEFPVFLEANTIEFDETGALKAALQVEAPPPELPACSDTEDNDGDGVTDFPDDPGCEDAQDDDETDPAPEPLRLDIPSQYQKTLKSADGKVTNLVILPAAQEELDYQFQLKTKGGDAKATSSFSVSGRSPSNGAFPFANSGLQVDTTGKFTGSGPSLVAGNYRYQLSATDGEQSVDFQVQIAVHDPFGNPIGLIIESDIDGGQQTCLTGKACQAFFRATKGIEPYTYGFSGESPLERNFLDVEAGQAFYNFTPSAEHVGTYNMSITVRDNSERVRKTDGEGEAGDLASFDVTLTIEEPEIEELPIATTFKFAAEPSCDFIDLSPVQEEYDYFQFTCRNGVMTGSQRAIRALDFLNRAEAAKITTLIEATQEDADAAFTPFVNLPADNRVNYQDVAVADWFAPYIYYLFSKGIVKDNVAYRPADTLTVAEAMKLVVEAYASLNDRLADELEDITGATDWFQPYQTIASYVNASIASADPGLPAERVLIAELLYKLYNAYPVDKFSP